MDECVTPMREQSEIYDVKFLKGFFRRRKNVFLFVCSIVLAVSILVAVFYPKTYVSAATFLIEGQMPEELVKGMSGGYIEERLQSITQQLLSYDKLLEIIREFSLYGEMKSAADEENAVKELREDISVRTIKAEDLDQRPSRARYSTVAFTLSYQGKDPVTVQKVASRLTALYAQKNIQSKEQIASQTVAILQQKMAEQRDRTAMLERKLNDYKVAHAGELPEAIPFNYEQINRLNTQLDELNTKIRNLEERKRNPEAALANQAGSDTSTTAPAATDPWTRVSQLRTQLVSLQARYSDKHPDVIKTKNELRQLEARLGISSEMNEDKRKLEELRARQAELKASQGPDHPEVVKLQQEIAALTKEIRNYKSQGAGVDPTEKELTRLTQQRADVQRRLSEYQRKSQMAPLVQKEYGKIATEYDDAVRQYNETMGKLAEVKLARGIDQTQLGERFTIIDEPKVPQKHDKPKRIRIILAGMLLSVFFGLFAAFMTENMDHSVKSVDQLQKLTNVPVLSVVSFIDLEEKHRDGRNRNPVLAKLEQWKTTLLNRLTGLRESR